MQLRTRTGSVQRIIEPGASCCEHKMDLVFLSCVLGLIAVLYLYVTRNYNYWEKQGIPTAKGMVPGLGHMAPVLFLQQSPIDISHQFYNDNKDASMIGIYDLTTPTLFIREPALIKTVMLTNFSSFHKNSLEADSKIEPLLSKNPFFNSGEEWMKARKRVTYAFSSTKLKMLTSYIEKVCVNMNNFVERRLGSSGKAEIELKDLFSRFTADSVASAGFGLEGHSFDDDDQHVSFQTMGKLLVEPSTRAKIAQLLMFVFPFLNNIFRQSFVPKRVDRFFRDIVHELVQIREREGTSRGDYFQLMVEFRKAENKTIDEELIAADALTFFMDGYESASTTLAFIGFRLAEHPEVQKKLREEIKAVLARHNGAITYDSLKEMTYMEQVISEAQRLNPVLGALMKRCTEDTVLEGSDGLTCKIKAGTPVMVALAPVHMDPKYWRDPEEFDPERFSEEGKKSIEKFTFMPFGEGPRTCVGMRIAWIMMKAALAAFFMKYSIKLSPKTRVPLKIVPGTFIIVVDGGIWVDVERVSP